MSEAPTVLGRTYRDQPYWRNIQRHLPDPAPTDRRNAARRGAMGVARALGARRPLSAPRRAGEAATAARCRHERANDDHNRRCPILLTQSAADGWTPLDISAEFLDRVRRVPVDTVMLDGAGHYPLEEPGLTQLQDAVAAFCQKVA